MKKMFLLFAISMSSSIVWGQIKKGTISFEKKVNNHRLMSVNEQMRAMIPEFRISNHILMFSDSVSLYRLIPEDEAPDPFAGGAGGARVMFRVGGGTDGGDMYRNFVDKKSVSSSELAGKNYLVTDSISQQPWKLLDETKKILGYTCYKAVRKSTIQSSGAIRMVVGGGPGAAPRTDSTTQKPREIEIIAWYAPDLLSPAGPEQYGALPGVILEIDQDNGVTVFTAKEVKTVVDEKLLKEPKKGKVVTSKEFAKMRLDLAQEQMQNMNMGGGGIRFGN